jgi:hypothetical protein
MQARAVIDGLPADVVALALPLDVQKIADAGLLREDWRKMYPLQSVGASAKKCTCKGVVGGWGIAGSLRVLLSCASEPRAGSKAGCRAHTV